MINRRLAVLVTALALVFGISGTGVAFGDTAGAFGSQPTAAIFATPNTAIITDPSDPRLKTRLLKFDLEVRGIIRNGGGSPGRSTLLDGVFWSSDLLATTYERSREFEVRRISTDGLHHTADLIRKQYHQESVLTFEYLPSRSPRAKAIEVTVYGVNVKQFHDALVANPEVRESLGGGSVTVNDGNLILIADRGDYGLIHDFVNEDLHNSWADSTLKYGAREFVG